MLHICLVVSLKKQGNIKDNPSLCLGDLVYQSVILLGICVRLWKHGN